MSGDRVLLVGMMGSGKSTVGRVLAGRLGWRYVDTDLEVEQATGKTVAELFAEGGEAAFRAEEAATLRRVLDDPLPAVVAVAGGAVLDPANRALLRDSGTVVWLRARPATLAARIVGGLHRPLLDGPTPGTVVSRLEAERRPLYEEVAEVVVDVDDLGPDEVAGHVLERLA